MPLPASRGNPAERAGCHTATVMIAVSQFLADELRRFYQVPNEKIHAVPNGVSYDAFDGFIDSDEVKGRYGIAPSAPTPSRLWPQPCPGPPSLTGAW